MFCIAFCHFDLLYRYYDRCISFLKDKDIIGEFVQGSYRGSAAVLGLAFIQNIYGKATIAPLMIIGSVPLYNILAVLILSFTGPGEHKLDKKDLSNPSKELRQILLF